MAKDDHSTNVTSINQQGGITAGTVNVGVQPRHMNSQVAGDIQRHIPKDARVAITAVWGDQEAFAFAHEIRAWMVQNGYTNLAVGVNQAAFAQPVQGQTLNKQPDGGFEIVIGGRQ